MTTPTDPTTPTPGVADPLMAEALEQAREVVRRALDQDRPAETTAAYPTTSFEVGMTPVRATPVDDLDAALAAALDFLGIGVVAPLRLIAGNIRIERDDIATERDSLAAELRTVVGKLHDARGALGAAETALNLVIGVENAVATATGALQARDAYITELEKLLLEDPKISASVTSRTMRTKIAAARDAAGAQA